MRFVLLLASCVIACSSGPSTPVVTCSNVTASASPGGCSLVAQTACSDGIFYEIDCQDDGTCTCTQDGMPGTAFITTPNICTNLDTSKLHDLGTQCAWNLSL